jgi:putative transposase
MPRRSRCPTDCHVFHVHNRCIQGVVLFEAAAQYEACLSLMRKAGERFDVRFYAYALMPNHWHMVLWCASGERLSRFMHWLETTHAQRWRSAKNLRGRGAVYQGRFKSVAVASDAQFLRVCRYVERNPPRARLVARAEDWEWTSASPLARTEGRPPLTGWPVARPEPWLEVLNEPEPRDELRELRSCLRKGTPFGLEAVVPTPVVGRKRRRSTNPPALPPADVG